MNHLAKEIAAEVVELIHHYGFDWGTDSVPALVDYWLGQYPPLWIRLATIEALYQGRYKVISIEQILNLWRRRDRALYHFNSEFERMISLRPMLSSSFPQADSTSASDREERGTTPQLTDAYPHQKNDAEEIRRPASSEPLPIDQFIPSIDSSDFYWRLKAVMQSMQTEIPEGIGRRN